MGSSNNYDSLLSEEECKKILNKCLHVSNEFISFAIKRFSDEVVGFLGEHLLLTITYRIENNLQEKTFFVKALPQTNENHKKYVNGMGVFEKETLVYNNLISDFLKIVSKPFAAQLYHFNDKCMVFEDLSGQSFKLPEGSLLSLEEVKSAVETTARFHAASIIFEEQRSKDGKKFRINEHFPKETCESTFSYIENHPRNFWLKTASECIKNLSKYFSNDPKMETKIHDLLFKEFPEILKPSKQFRNVVNHDDLHALNLMFNKDKCILVDFQLTRYTPPMFDLLLLLYINLDIDCLEKNRKCLLEDYYCVVEGELKRYKLDGNKVFSKEEFWESVDVYHLPALMEAALYGTNVFLPKQMAKTIVSNQEIFEEFTFKNRSPFVIKSYESDEKYKKRFDNILIPLYKSLEQK